MTASLPCDRRCSIQISRVVITVSAIHPSAASGTLRLLRDRDLQMSSCGPSQSCGRVLEFTCPTPRKRLHKLHRKSEPYQRFRVLSKDFSSLSPSSIYRRHLHARVSVFRATVIAAYLRVSCEFIQVFSRDPKRPWWGNRFRTRLW